MGRNLWGTPLVYFSPFITPGTPEWMDHGHFLDPIYCSKCKCSQTNPDPYPHLTYLGIQDRNLGDTMDYFLFFISASIPMCNQSQSLISFIIYIFLAAAAWFLSSLISCLGDYTSCPLPTPHTCPTTSILVPLRSVIFTVTRKFIYSTTLTMLLSRLKTLQWVLMVKRVKPMLSTR